MPVAVDPMADAVDAAELLGVDVQQAPGSGVLVALRWHFGLDHPPEPTEPQALQHRRDRRARDTDLLGDLPGRLASPSQPLDALDHARRRLARRVPRPRGAVLEPALAFESEALQPLVGSSRTHTGC